MLNKNKKKKPIYANGRKAILQAIDKLMSKEETLIVFKQAFAVAIIKDPIAFYKDIIMPLTPKEMLTEGLEVNEDLEQDIRDILKLFDDILHISTTMAPFCAILGSSRLAARWCASDLDLWRAAQVMVKHYGDSAATEAG